MKSKIKDLTIEEFQSLISSTVKDTIEEAMEDLLALSSENFLESIKEARNDYKKGNYKFFVKGAANTAPLTCVLLSYYSSLNGIPSASATPLP